MSNIILERRYYAVEVENLSPLCISGGVDENTDADLMRNAEDTIFVPGTSLAGAFRNYFNYKKDEKNVFGYSKDKDGAMSSVYISDLYFEETDDKVSVRDRINLSEQENKFDLEIMETGAAGTLYMNFVYREKDDWNADEIMKIIFQGLIQGEIRIGANKNRGFGCLTIKSIYEKSFTKENMDEWIDFVSESHKTDAYGEPVSYEKWMRGKEMTADRYIKIEVPLRLQGGISIRRYSTEPGKADYEHLKCNGKPVIPGTSWNGAIRSACGKVLERLGVEKDEVNAFIKEWFGYVTAKAARQSRIVIGESILEGAKEVPTTRNSVNRFSAATKSGALYTGISCYGGTTSLNLMIPKVGEYKTLLGVLMLVMKEIQTGYLPIGGQAAIGNGIFEKDDNKGIVFSESISEEECLKSLYLYLDEVAK